ncbi:MAG: cytochrome P450 [Alphaproteobacteria bacterium]
MSTATLDYTSVADPKAYADEKAIHALFADMRRNDPVHWQEPEGHRPFWSITKHADIMAISRRNDIFLNGPRATLATIAEEEWVKEATGGSHLLLRTLIHMDNPDHKVFRGMTLDWFQPKNLNRLEAGIADLARQVVDRMEAKDGACDFVNDVAIWYPLRVIMMILGVPEEDEARMLKLTQELFGARDPELARDMEGKGLDMSVIQDFFDYFTKVTEDRRANPRDDVATVIANAKIDGEAIGHLEAMSYYIIVATAGHDTTSSASSGGLLALIQNPDELAKLKADPALLSSAVDEMIRWTTPVKHFMRTATEDYEIRGKTIRKDDAVMLHYPSANRDEEVFVDPERFRIDRSPNRHVAFGYGAHLCLGQALAKMEMRALFRELISRIDQVSLAGDPALVQATFVSGLKRLPIRYTMS